MLANEGAHRLPCSAGNSPSTVSFITCTRAPSIGGQERIPSTAPDHLYHVPGLVFGRILESDVIVEVLGYSRAREIVGPPSIASAEVTSTPFFSASPAMAG